MANATYVFEQEAPQVQEALRDAFPGSMVVTRPSYGGRVGVVIIATQLDGLAEDEKVSVVHQELRERLGAGAVVVGNVRAYSSDEL